MTEFVVLEAGGDGIFAAEDARARDNARDYAGFGLEVVRLVVLDRGEVGRNVLADFLEIR